MNDPLAARMMRRRADRIEWRIIARIVGPVGEPAFDLLCEIVERTKLAKLYGEDQGRPATNVSHAIKTLLKYRLVEEKPAMDRRVKEIVRTPKGDKLVERAAIALEKARQPNAFDGRWEPADDGLPASF